MDLFREKHTLQTECGPSQKSRVALGEIHSTNKSVGCSLKMWCGYVLWLGSAGKESTCNVGDLGLIPGLGRSPGEVKGYSLQYFGLENTMDCTVHGVEESDTTE